ncbi:hypothetical protein F5883DRAFT_168597 [Diaporthe sp. PMI_573]|nr:hypothetical protein F5883DRAFT_168597 [Diaporthaceae sp. PMI_573]
MGGGPYSAGATSPPFTPALLVLFRHVLALRKTSIDKLACVSAWLWVLGRDWNGPAGSRHQRFLERPPGGEEVASGPGHEGKRGWEDLTWGSCRASCFYFSSQLHACLLCLALPCLALSCLASPPPRTPFFLHQFPWRMDGKMTDFFPCFAHCKSAFSSAPAPPHH